LKCRNTTNQLTNLANGQFITGSENPLIYLADTLRNSTIGQSSVVYYGNPVPFN